MKRVHTVKRAYPDVAMRSLERRGEDGRRVLLLNFWFADNAGAMHALRRREAFERLLARSCHIPHRALSTAKRRTLYDTLGVQSTASDDEIRQARVLGGREEGEGLC